MTAVLQTWLDSIGWHPANQQHFPIRPYNLALCPPAGACILDVGAHTGANLVYYARRGFPCVGVEAAAGCVALFEREMEKLPFLRPRPVMVHALFEDYEPDELFDAALCGEMLCYMADPEPTVVHLARCLRSGAVALVTVPSLPQPEFPTHLELDQLAALMSDHGFGIDWCRPLQGMGNAWVNAVRCYKGDT